MISHISGMIIRKTSRYAVFDSGGVGYLVFATAATLQSLPGEGKSGSLWTYLIVRENALDLYGFTTEEERTFFELLLDVSGIGPKSALGILDIASVQTLRKAIASNDTSYLTTVSGIGKKTAAKIVVELKDKLLAYAPESGDSGLREESDALEALLALGYRQQEAREALQAVPEEIRGTNARIKEALKILGQ